MAADGNRCREGAVNALSVAHYTCNVAAATREFFSYVRTCPDVMQSLVEALGSSLISVRDHSSAAASGPIAKLVIRLSNA